MSLRPTPPPPTPPIRVIQVCEGEKKGSEGRHEGVNGFLKWITSLYGAAQALRLKKVRGEA